MFHTFWAVKKSHEIHSPKAAGEKNQKYKTKSVPNQEYRTMVEPTKETKDKSEQEKHCFGFIIIIMSVDCVLKIQEI